MWTSSKKWLGESVLEHEDGRSGRDDGLGSGDVVGVFQLMHAHLEADPHPHDLHHVPHELCVRWAPRMRERRVLEVVVLRQCGKGSCLVGSFLSWYGMW